MHIRQILMTGAAIAGLFIAGSGVAAAAQPARSVVSSGVSAPIMKPLGTTPNGTSWPGINCRNDSKEVNLPYPEVAVPGNYCYDPSTNIHRAWHDYCTKSQDSYSIVFVGTADFRGPCANHDLCLNYKNGHNYCDPRLLHDLDHNCQYSFGPYNPFRATCETKAYAMYLVIRLINA